jgi:hypothetical protein
LYRHTPARFVTRRSSVLPSPRQPHILGFAPASKRPPLSDFFLLKGLLHLVLPPASRRILSRTLSLQSIHRNLCAIGPFSCQASLAPISTAFDIKPLSTMAHPSNGSGSNGANGNGHQRFFEDFGVWKESPVLKGSTQFEPLPDVKNIMITGGAGFMYVASQIPLPRCKREALKLTVILHATLVPAGLCDT